MPKAGSERESAPLFAAHVGHEAWVGVARHALQIALGKAGEVSNAVLDPAAQRPSHHAQQAFAHHEHRVVAGDVVRQPALDGVFQAP